MFFFEVTFFSMMIFFSKQKFNVSMTMMDGVSQVSCRSTIEFNPAINAQTNKKKILVDLTDNAMAM